ncbi:hypothetical protein ACIA5D_31310 [Actinoplanes sp. NPDC051513]|uniref:hypothetical protein n=1 Tax=Actinoplanes sp. NPDC051513 TaxID=3363908 RepID=UPI00378F01BB
MNSRSLVAGLAAAATLVLASPPAAAQPPEPLTFDRSTVSVGIGDRFTLTSRHPADAGPGPLIAHLNVVSLTPDVYVDPEDWSSERTQPVPATPGLLEWTIQAVNAGTFDIYIVLVPTAPAAATQPLTVSVPVRVTVANRRTINAAGALPVIIAVPAAIAVLAGLLRRRRTHPC